MSRCDRCKHGKEIKGQGFSLCLKEIFFDEYLFNYCRQYEPKEKNCGNCVYWYAKSGGTDYCSEGHKELFEEGGKSCPYWAQGVQQ